VPTAQVLPPVVPGFRRLPVTRPDLTAARRLVGEAGSVGAAVTLWGHTTAPAPALTDYMAGVLRRLGFRVTVRLLPKPLLLSTLGMRSTRSQIGYARWQQDLPDGQDWFGLLLHGREVRVRDTLNYARLDDPGVNDLIDRAASTADPAARAAAWTDVEQAVARLAPWVPVANTVRTDVTSRRVRGYVAHQTYGFLWAQASVD
jgi:peptide/nickel transport system substrate-binding protein